MAIDIDQRLARFRDGDITVMICQGLLDVLPYARPLAPAYTMEAMVAAAAPGAGPPVVAQAREYAAEEAARTSVWIATGMDAGDGVIPVLSGLRSALALYLSKGAPEGEGRRFRDVQAGDAVLKGLALSEVIRRVVPGTPEERARAFLELETGRALVGYFAAIEVALPFIDRTVASEPVFSAMVDAQLSAQGPRLGKVVGADAVRSATEQLAWFVPTIDRLVVATREKIAPVAEIVQERLPPAMRVAGGVGAAFATGVDVLPMYRFLGTRLVAEQAAVRAARVAGLFVVPNDVSDFLAKYLPDRPAILPGQEVPEVWAAAPISAVLPAEADLPADAAPAVPGGAPPFVEPGEAASSAPSPADLSTLGVGPLDLPPSPSLPPRVTPLFPPPEALAAPPPEEAPTVLVAVVPPEPPPPPPPKEEPPPPPIRLEPPPPVARVEPIPLPVERAEPPPGRFERAMEPKVREESRPLRLQEAVVEPPPPPRPEPAPADSWPVVDDEKPRISMLGIAIAVAIVLLVACAGFSIFGGGAGLYVMADEEAGQDDHGKGTSTKGSGKGTSSKGSGKGTSSKGSGKGTSGKGTGKSSGTTGKGAKRGKLPRNR